MFDENRIIRIQKLINRLALLESVGLPFVFASLFYFIKALNLHLPQGLLDVIFSFTKHLCAEFACDKNLIMISYLYQCMIYILLLTSMCRILFICFVIIIAARGKMTTWYSPSVILRFKSQFKNFPLGMYGGFLTVAVITVAIITSIANLNFQLREPLMRILFNYSKLCFFMLQLFLLSMGLYLFYLLLFAVCLFCINYLAYGYPSMDA